MQGRTPNVWMFHVGEALLRVGEDSPAYLAMRTHAAQAYAGTFEPSDAYGKLTARVLKFGGFPAFARS